jgi:hypothetical protein
VLPWSLLLIGSAQAMKKVLQYTFTLTAASAQALLGFEC